MKRTALFTLAAAVLAAFVPVSAPAKGASEATITGPGLGRPISLPGEGQPGGEQLMQIAQEAGFFPAVFTQTPDPMLEERPSGVFGPKYTVTYVMPGPNNEEDTLVQELYPYASPEPVAYVEPGQRFWTTERTRGGWYVASPTLKELLVAAGLPRNAPGTGDGSSEPWRVIGPVLLVVFVALLALAAAVFLRRRPQTA